jgi:hypothetical protein
MDALVYILLALLKAHTFVQTFDKIGPKASTARASGGTSPSGQDMQKVGKPVQKTFLKVPQASQLLPKNAIKQTQPLKAPSEAKISVVAYKYSVKAMLLVERCPNVELWVIIVQHLCWPSETFHILQHFPAYWQRAHLAEGIQTRTLHELDAEHNSRIVIESSNDPPQLVDPSGDAFYVAGTKADEKNTINKLHGDFKDRHSYPQAGEVFAQPF